MASKTQVKDILSEEGLIEVSRTIVGKPVVKTEKIKVRPFAVHPAQVEVHKGAWFPTGEMRGAKLDITIRVPCYIEEILPVFKQVNKMVDVLMEKEYAKLSGEEEEE